MREKEVKFYRDELNDEFSGITRQEKIIDEHYPYIHKNIFWRMAEFFIWGIVMHPIAVLYCKIHFHTKIVNGKVLKPFRKQGYFLFANHTQVPGDAFFPNLLVRPKKPYVVVNSDNVALKGTEWFMQMVGALPLPSSLKGYKNFMNALKERYEQKHVLLIYPEAHIWPYYTGIRPFKDTSFSYPVKFGAPTFSFTVTYQNRKNSEKVNVTLYVDGPFYAEGETAKAKQSNLRNQVYDAMCERAKNSTYEYIEYRKVEE